MLLPQKEYIPYVRWGAFFTTFASIISYVLILLCLLAGHGYEGQSERMFKESINILTVNTTMLSNSSATSLGIHQWYSMHILNYCEGYWAPSAASPNSYKDIVYCAARTSMYDFNLTAILAQELAKGGSGVTLSELNWPTSIQSGIDELGSEMDAAFVLYCIGIALSILVMFGGIVGILAWGDLRVVHPNMWLSFFAFLSLDLASGLATNFASRVTNLINVDGSSIGVTAALGSKFLAMTWSATVIMLLCCFAWVAERVRGKKLPPSLEEGPVRGGKSNSLADSQI